VTPRELAAASGMKLWGVREARIHQLQTKSLDAAYSSSPQHRTHPGERGRSPAPMADLFALGQLAAAPLCAASETAVSDKVDGDTSIGFLRDLAARFFERLAVRPFFKKPRAELARMTSTPPIKPYRAISHRVFLAPAATLSARNWAISASELIVSANLACSTSCLAFSASRFACSASSSTRSAPDLALSSSAILLVEIAKSAYSFSIVCFNLDGISSWSVDAVACTAATSRWRAHFGRDSPEGHRRACCAFGAVWVGNLDRFTHRVAVAGRSTGYWPQCGLPRPRHFDARHYRVHISCDRQHLVKISVASRGFQSRRVTMTYVWSKPGEGRCS